MSSTNTFNPVPEVTEVLPDWVNHGSCYSTAVYESEEVAREVAAAVRASGRTVNGGFYHGSPLGAVYPGYTLKSGEPGWGVTF